MYILLKKHPLQFCIEASESLCYNYAGLTPPKKIGTLVLHHIQLYDFACSETGHLFYLCDHQTN